MPNTNPIQGDDHPTRNAAAIVDPRPFLHCTTHPAQYSCTRDMRYSRFYERLRFRELLPPEEAVFDSSILVRSNVKVLLELDATSLQIPTKLWLCK